MTAPGTVDFVGIAALVSAVGAAVGVVVASVRGQKKEASKPGDPAREAPAAVVPVPLPDPSSSEDMLKFMAILQADNVSLRQGQTEQAVWRATAEKTIDDLVQEVASAKREQVKFRDAFARYLELIFREWGKGGERPPLPSGDDLVVLRDAIPRT